MVRTIRIMLLLGTALAARDSKVVRRDWETMSPAQRKAFTDAVHALVMDSAPGELEPGMVAASFDAMLQKKAVAATATTDKPHTYETTRTVADVHYMYLVSNPLFAITSWQTFFQ